MVGTLTLWDVQCLKMSVGNTAWQFPNLVKNDWQHSPYSFTAFPCLLCLSWLPYLMESTNSQNAHRGQMMVTSPQIHRIHKNSYFTIDDITIIWHLLSFLSQTHLNHMVHLILYEELHYKKAVIVPYFYSDCLGYMQLPSGGMVQLDKDQLSLILACQCTINSSELQASLCFPQPLFSFVTVSCVSN